MNLRQSSDCWLVLVLSLASVGLACFQEGPVVLRAVIGLPFVLFCPGYALVSALFPAQGDLSFPARMALACGCSLALIPLIGLLLNYTPWGIHPGLLCAALTLMIAVLSTLAWRRRMALPDDERCRLPRLPWDKNTLRHALTLNRGLEMVLGVALVFAGAALGWVNLHPKAADEFTAFYILGPQGQAAGYPRYLSVGEGGRVIMGVENHEGKKVTYRAEVVIGSRRVAVVNPFTLEDGEGREKTVSFAGSHLRGDVMVEFLLFRLGDVHPCQSLHLWMRVRDRGRVTPPGAPR